MRSFVPPSVSAFICPPLFVVWDGYGMGMGWVRDGYRYGMGMGLDRYEMSMGSECVRIWDGYGRGKGWVQIPKVTLWLG